MEFTFSKTIEVTFEDNFDFDKTYTEYGFDVTCDQWNIPRYCNDFLHLFTGIKAIHFLHNCAVVKTMNLGTDNEMLTEIKEKFKALKVCVTTFSPYIKEDIKDNSVGLVYNIFFDENCCPIKYPKK